MDQHDRIKLVPDGGGIYRKYGAPDIIEAARMVQEDHVSVYKAAKEKGIPWSSLKRYVTENPGVNSVTGLKKLGRPFALKPEMEQKVFNCVISMQELGFGLTVEQVKVIAFGVAEASGRGHFFNKQKKARKQEIVAQFQREFLLGSTDGLPKPMLLLIDSHGAHITPQVIELTKENAVHILTFPSHTTRILQPLDVGVYKALKSVCQKKFDNYMAEHPTDKPNKQVFHSIFKVPFLKAITVIPKEKLVPSLLTERPVPEEVVPSDANPRLTIAETNPGIQTLPSPVDNILKLPTADPRKEHTRGRVRPNPKAKIITENLPTVHQTVNKQRPQRRQKVEVHHATLGPSRVQLQKRRQMCVFLVLGLQWMMTTVHVVFEMNVFPKIKKLKMGRSWCSVLSALLPTTNCARVSPSVALFTCLIFVV
ncbi:hypothetical protein PR048_004656 [Dryococelus australis]|uniref:DDE-1 domain-containing protein n=1 Tax=Dryococelus australis TaxID=614101 RepID=A0ABQ9I608_9NEOP|nr:hypothetical protein PR048_004656 [Dryococelus australis]